MAKSWKSFVKPQATSDNAGEAAPAPNWQELAQQNETLQQLLQERAQLEQQMQQLTGQPKPDAPTDKYSNEIPSFGQRKKNDGAWQQQKEEQKKQAQQREANRRDAMRAWEAKKAAQAQKTQLARKALNPAPAQPKLVMAAGKALQQLKALKKQQAQRQPEKLANALERAKDLKKQVSSGGKLKDTWEQLKALKQQKRNEQPGKRSALNTAFEKLKNKPRPAVNELRKGIKKIKERSPKEIVERLKQKKAELLKPLGKQAEKLDIIRPKIQNLQKAKENLKLEEKREQLLEKLRLKKKWEAQWDRGAQKVEDLMAQKAEAEKKWKEIKEMEAGEKSFEDDAPKKEQQSDAKAEEKRQAEKEEQRRKEREEQRRQQRQEQRREERRSERKKDKYS